MSSNYKDILQNNYVKIYTALYDELQVLKLIII